jgi:hypothetical protein
MEGLETLVAQGKDISKITSYSRHQIKYQSQLLED